MLLEGLNNRGPTVGTNYIALLYFYAKVCTVCTKHKAQSTNSVDHSKSLL